MSAIHLASIMAHKETSPKFRMEDPIGKPSLINDELRNTSSRIRPNDISMNISLEEDEEANFGTTQRQEFNPHALDSTSKEIIRQTKESSTLNLTKVANLSISRGQTGNEKRPGFSIPFSEQNRSSKADSVIQQIAKNIDNSKKKFCCCRRKLHNFRMNPRIKKKWLKVLRKILIISRVITILQDLLKEKEEGKKKKEEVDKDIISSLIRLRRPTQGTLKNDASNKCVILPDSNAMWFWVIFIIILIGWSAIYIPYRVAYLDDVSLALWILETVIDFIFVIDIFINFFEAYYQDDGTLITNNCTIAKRYLRTWFLLDLISSLPFQILDSPSQDNPENNINKIPRIYKMLKVLRIAKIMNIQKPAKFFETIYLFIKLHSGIERLCKVFLTMIIFIHFYSCLWYLIAKMRSFAPDCWVMQLSIMDETNLTKYLISFCWVLQTLTTVGYGDMPLSNNIERILAIILMIGGVGFYSYTIGNLSSIFSDIDSKQATFNAKILSLNEYANQIKMPPNLYFKILRIMEKNSKKSYISDFDQESLLRELPTALRTEIQSVTQKKILESFFFLKDKPPHFVKDVLKYLKHISLSPDEVIYRKGDPAEELYFLLKGRIGFVTDDGFIYRNYAKGSYYGDLEIFQEKPFRRHTAITMEEVEFLIIKKENLLNILKNYPKIYEEMKNVALNRFDNNKNALKVAKKANFKVDDEMINLVKGDPNSNLYKDFFGQGLIWSDTKSKFTIDEDEISLTTLSSKISSSSDYEEEDHSDLDSLEELETPKLHPIKKTSKKRLFQIKEAASFEEMTPNIDYVDKFAQKEALFRGMDTPMFHQESISSVEEGKRVENTFSERYNFKQIVHSKPNFLSNDSPSKEQNKSKSKYSLGRMPREEEKLDEPNKIGSPSKRREEKRKSRLIERRLRRVTMKRALKENLEGMMGISNKRRSYLEGARRVSENKIHFRSNYERKNSKIQDSQGSIKISTPERSGEFAYANLDELKLAKSPYNQHWGHNQGSDEGLNSSLFFPARKQSTNTIMSNMDTDGRLAELQNNLNLLIKANSLQFKKICNIVGKLTVIEKRASKNYSGSKERGVSIQW